MSEVALFTREFPETNSPSVIGLVTSNWADITVKDGEDVDQGHDARQ